MKRYEKRTMLRMFNIYLLKSLTFFEFYEDGSSGKTIELTYFYSVCHVLIFLQSSQNFFLLDFDKMCFSSNVLKYTLSVFLYCLENNAHNLKLKLIIQQQLCSNSVASCKTKPIIKSVYFVVKVTEKLRAYKWNKRNCTGEELKCVETHKPYNKSPQSFTNRWTPDKKGLKQMLWDIGFK